MNTPPPKDPKLAATLREWRTEPAPPPGFPEAVWRRIERAEQAGARRPSLRDWGLASLFEPRWATLLLLLALVLGGISGASSGMARAREIAAARYLASVDPYQRAP